MPDNNKNQNASDFGMEANSSAERGNGPMGKPVVNNYAAQNANQNKTPIPDQKSVNPANGTPPASPSADQVKSTVKTDAKGRPLPQNKKSEANPEARKKAVLGCLGAFGGMMIILLILSFVFLAQGDSQNNPIARLLGLNYATFVNGLITFIHIIFILIALTAFVFTMVGLFQASMAKKEDKVARKKGLRTSLIAGIVLLLILISWMFVYIYLDAKRIDTGGAAIDQIITDPEDTIGLTAPVEIKFDASNIRVDSSKYQIVSYDWDFGDGSDGTNQITSHIYKEKGTYNVVMSLTVKDLETGDLIPGGEFAHTVSIANQALTALFTADPQSGEAPLKVTLDASDSADPDGFIDRYEWDLDGDGQFDDATGVNVVNTFEKVGTYDVGLRVVNTTGESDVYEKEIVVEEMKIPQALIEITDEPSRFEMGVQYIFKGENSTSPNGDINKYAWDFGDGTKVVTTQTAAHTFTNTGTYTVKLKVTDEEGDTGETSKVIQVGNQRGTPKAVILTEPAVTDGAIGLSGKVPFQVSFDASSSTDSDNNIVQYEWDFNGDGTVDSYNAKTSYTYEESGTYTVALKVIDGNQNIGKASTVVKVAEQGIIADLKADKVDGSVPLTVSFDASGSSYKNGQITSYRWDFGDDSEVKLGAPSMSHKYTKIGTYTATVTVIGADNSTASDSLLITVRETPLTACFTSVFNDEPAPLETTFDPACSTGTIKNYFWDFGDGFTSTDVKPEHTFEEEGEYRVVLEISDNDNNISKAEVIITVTE